MKNASMICFSLLGGLLVAPSALAFSDGQTEVSGRLPGESCLKCHGTEQYAGTTVEVVGAEMGTCVDGEGSLLMLPILDAGAAYTLKVTVKEPTADEAVCPANNCCDDADVPGADAACLTRDPEDNIVCGVDNFTACCQTLFNDCPDGKSAGFNIEATDPDCSDEVGCTELGQFAADQGAGIRLGTRLGEPIENQATHSVAKTFDGDVVWDVSYTAPNQADNGISFWTGVNVANGNFIADVGDLNSNFRLDAIVKNGEVFTAPPYCATCPNGVLPDAEGNCPACTCVGAGANSLPAGLAGLLLLGFFVGRRRRR